LGINNLVLYILKPRDILTGSSGTLKYNPNLFNVLIANGLVTCNQTVASPEYVENVVSSMKTNNVLLINQNAPTVEENTPLVVKLARNFNIDYKMITSMCRFLVYIPSTMRTD
jgi:hypothetical protein